jgi:hypothetical protein
MSSTHPIAILTALLWAGLGMFSAVYLSESIISDGRPYGAIGVVFSLMVWFVAIGAVIVLGAGAAPPGTSAKTVPGRQDLAIDDFRLWWLNGCTAMVALEGDSHGAGYARAVGRHVTG